MTSTSRPEIHRRIFVLGVPRSGSTLVQSLLAAHDELTSFTESHFFDRHFSRLGSSRAVLSRNPAPRVAEYLEENGEELAEASRWFLEAFQGIRGARPLLPFKTKAAACGFVRVLDELAQRRGASGWVEKTPRHLRYLPFFERTLTPDDGLFFVHVIRDGLETVASLHEASKRWERPYDLAECVRRWNGDVAFSLSRVGSLRDVFVLYEELTARPEATLRLLLEQLRLPWQADLLDRYGEAAGRLVTGEEEAWKAGTGRPIRASATSRKTLTAEERQRVSAALRTDLYEKLRERSGTDRIGGGPLTSGSPVSDELGSGLPGDQEAVLEDLDGEKPVGGSPADVNLDREASVREAAGTEGTSLLPGTGPGLPAAEAPGRKEAGVGSGNGAGFPSAEDGGRGGASVGSGLEAGAPQAEVLDPKARGPHPLVSVIVPYFNSERHLAACIESLLKQEGVEGGYEIILVDNGSTDGSASIVEGYADGVVLEESTPGAYAARNTGIRRAQAPVIAFTDADCVVETGWLRSILEALEDPTVGILVGHCRYPREASLPLRLLGAYENAKTSFVADHCPPAHRFAYANNMTVRREVFERVGLFKEWKRAGDTELVHRLAAGEPSWRFVYEPSVRVTHREFLRARDRARRLSLYTNTNSKIETFRELSFGQRLRVLGRLALNLRAYW